MSNWRHSLAIRSMLSQVLGLSAVVIIVGLLQLGSSGESLATEAKRVGETAAAILSEEISQAPQNLEPEYLQPLADRLTGKLVNVSRIVFADADGRVLAESTPFLENPATAAASANRSRGDRIEIVAPIFGHYDPVRRSNRVGTVSVEVDLALTRQRLQRAFLQSMALLLALIPAYWLFEYLFLGRTMLRRLGATAGAASALSAGDYAARTGVSGRDELGQVGEAFDEMASRLEASHALLQEEIVERNAAQERVRALNTDLNTSMASVRAHNHAIGLLNDLSKVMQSCTSVNEALSIIPRYARDLLADAPGGIYLLHPSRDHLELTAEFAPSSGRVERFFGPDKCWGMRLGKPHVSRTEGPVICPHLHDLSPGCEYHCVPLLAQSDALGLLQARFESGPLNDTDKDARVVRLIALAEQLGIALANLRLRETLRQQSIRDPLTNLFNRRYLEETLQREIERAHRTDGALTTIMLDADHFKRFNDNFGHDAGDHVLEHLARLLSRSTRGSDIACRFGGEEFVLVLVSASHEIGLQRAEELRKAVAGTSLQFMGRDLGDLTISLGVASLCPDIHTAAELLKLADERLFQAKVQGRNRVVGAETPST